MIVVVGEAVGKGGTRAHLARLFHVSVIEMMESVLWINLWEYPHTTTSLYVDAVERIAQPGDVVLLLGRRVVRAFGLEELPALGSVVRGAGVGPLVVAIPHPSGRNRWYNDADHALRATSALGHLWRVYR